MGYAEMGYADTFSVVSEWQASSWAEQSRADRLFLPRTLSSPDSRTGTGTGTGTGLGSTRLMIRGNLGWLAGWLSRTWIPALDSSSKLDVCVVRRDETRRDETEKAEKADT